ATRSFADSAKFSFLSSIEKRPFGRPFLPIHFNGRVHHSPVTTGRQASRTAAGVHGAVRRPRFSPGGGAERPARPGSARSPVPGRLAGRPPRPRPAAADAPPAAAPPRAPPR